MERRNRSFRVMRTDTDGNSDRSNRISLDLNVERNAADNQPNTSRISRRRTLPAVPNNSELSARQGVNSTQGGDNSIRSRLRRMMSSVGKGLRRVTSRRDNSERTTQSEQAGSSNSQLRTNRRSTQTTNSNQRIPQAAISHDLPGNRSDQSTSQQNPLNQQVAIPAQRMPRVHTTVDFVHCMVPDLSTILNCGYYWGVMDRYEAERLLENKAEGTFLLRDSSQNDFLFSVSFRRYGRSLHARVEQWDHNFSFDIHDSNIYKAKNIHTLLEHYKDPQTCLFFEPMLTKPLNRPHVFSLQQLSRGKICDHITYDDVDSLPVSRQLQEYLKFYHYKQRVRIRTYSGSDDGDYQSVPA